MACLVFTKNVTNIDNYDKNVAVFFTRDYIQTCKLASLMYGIREMTSPFQTKSLLQSRVLYCAGPSLDSHFKTRLEATSKQMSQKKKEDGEDM